jgi:hypothetical protein
VTREKDGTMWRILKDKDVIAVIRPQDEVQGQRAA